MATDIFSSINNAVLDLQASQFQSFERPLKVLGRLLRHADLRQANDELVAGLDLSAFLTASEETQGGMIGSATLQWPDDDRQTLGLTLLLILKFADDPDYMTDFGHTFYYSGSKLIAGIHAITGQLIIPFVRDFRAYVQNRGVVTTKVVHPLSKRIFIVHGHDEGAREAVARFLERLGFEPVILHEQANKGRTVIEKVEANSDVSFVVVLLTPDDEGCAKGCELEPRARQNVLLELGYFIGKLGRDRVCALKRGQVEIPSDFAGVVWETFDNSNGWKLTLARELEAVGHPVDWNKIHPGVLKAG